METIQTLQIAKKLRKTVLNRQYPSVDINHSRVHHNPKGGMTVVRYWLDKGVVITGIAFCWEDDTYNKQNGKSIAYGRLMRNLKLTGISKTKLRKHWDYVGDRIGNVNPNLVLKAFEGERIE